MSPSSLKSSSFNSGKALYMALLTLFLIQDDFSDIVSLSVRDLPCERVWLFLFEAFGYSVAKWFTPTIELLALSGYSSSPLLSSVWFKAFFVKILSDLSFLFYSCDKLLLWDTALFASNTSFCLKFYWRTLDIADEIFETFDLEDWLQLNLRFRADSTAVESFLVDLPSGERRFS